jgi:diacylglycerol kinase family enzyme
VEAGVDLLFVWGGDSSVQRCLDAVRKAPVTLAILPAGTANLFATNLGIPADLEEAVESG